MTREQAAQLVAILVGHYPSAKFTRENAQVWTETLQELDAERTHDAVRKLVRTEKWMPSLAHIFELVSPPRSQLSAPYHRPFPDESGPRALVPIGQALGLVTQARATLKPGTIAGQTMGQTADNRRDK